MTIASWFSAAKDDGEREEKGGREGGEGLLETNLSGLALKPKTHTHISFFFWNGKLGGLQPFITRVLCMKHQTAIAQCSVISPSSSLDEMPLPSLRGRFPSTSPPSSSPEVKRGVTH